MTRNTILPLHYKGLFDKALLPHTIFKYFEFILSSKGFTVEFVISHLFETKSACRGLWSCISNLIDFWQVAFSRLLFFQNFVK